jgi:hypothetical protein
MKNRRTFLAAVASSLVLAKADPAAAQSTPAPAASPSDKPVSAVSAAVALSMRGFDSTLTDAELQTIAKAIDANNDTAKALNPKKKRLKNGDAPVVVFTVAGGEA